MSKQEFIIKLLHEGGLYVLVGSHLVTFIIGKLSKQPDFMNKDKK